jgi:DNA-binding CsgD family transcriptional regulator
VQLTKRQREVAERLVDGMTIAAIADALSLTESRVNQIIRALKDRFEVDTQAGIVAAYQRAVETGAMEEEAEEEPGAGSETLVPDILNAPHPVLYRLVAIALAALLIALTLFVLTKFALTVSGIPKPTSDASTAVTDSRDD